MNTKIFLTIIFGLASVSANAAWIKSICTQTGPNFQLLYPQVQLLAWNLVDAFEAAPKTLGSGAFGLVKKVDTGISGIGEVAVKRSKINDQMAADLAGAELNVMKVINHADPQVGPRLFGCQYTIEYDFLLRQNVIKNVYTVQELLSKELKDFMETLRTWDHKRVLALQIGIVKRLGKLWELGFQHADMKLENVMMNAAQTEALLIDFNLSQSNTARRSLRGTNMYMAPAVQRREGFVRPKDDLFSWAMMFAAVYVAGGIDGVWSNIKQDCYTKVMEPACEDTLAYNVGYILSNSGWGEVQTDKRLHTSEYINVSTLLANLARYENYDNTFEEIVFILERNLAEMYNPSLIKVLPPVAQEVPPVYQGQENPVNFAPQPQTLIYTKPHKIIGNAPQGRPVQPTNIVRIQAIQQPVQNVQVIQNPQPMQLPQELIDQGYRLVTNYHRGHHII